VQDGNVVFSADNGEANTTQADYFYLDGGSATHDGSATTALYTIWPDLSRIALGSGKDLQLYHDGINNFITSGNTGFYVQGDYPRIQSSGGENMIAANVNAEVNLYFNNVNKFQTTSYGTNTSGRGTIVDTTNPGGDGTASGGGVLTVEGRRDGTANVLTLRARDESAPAVALPDGQGSIVRWQGFDGTDFAQMGAIAVVADGQAVANSDAPSKMVFYTVPDATETLTPALTLDKSQNATFEGDVEVNGNLVVDAAGVSTDFQLRRSVNAAALLTINAPGGSPNGSVFSINGSSVMTLDENQKATFAGDVQVDGDLIVTGNTTSVNVEDLNVEQGEITLNYAASSDTSSSANGAGIRIQDAVDASNDATILWDQPNLEFDFSHGASFAGQVETKNNAGIYSFSDTVNASSSEDIFTLSNSHGAQAFRVTFVCNTSGFSVAKTFEVVHQFAGTPVFAKVVDTGAYSSNDFSVAFANDNDQGMKCTITNASTTINADIVTTVFLGGSPTDITVTEL
jgi:hypothetical protein